MTDPHDLRECWTGVDRRPGGAPLTLCFGCWFNEPEDDNYEWRNDGADMTFRCDRCEWEQTA